MPFLAPLNLILISIFNPLVTDSTIYSVNVYKMTVKEQRLASDIIDYCVDDFLYVLTYRYLYKIDPDNLSINDRMPLPQKFNYLTTNNKNIMLISTNEIVILDKTNLAFKTGIGIERGDYRPMILPQRLNVSEKNRLIYLTTTSGKKTTMKIFNLNNGRLIKKINVSKILSYEYDSKHNILTTLDINNRLTFYDMHLHKKNVIDLNLNGKRFSEHENGYVVYCEYGVFFVNKSGKLIDFQPMTLQKNREHEKFVFLTEKGIVHLDPLTFRPKKVYQNEEKIMKLFATDYSNYTIALDADNDFHLIDINAMEMEPIKERQSVIKGIKLTIPTMRTDSLWYFQVGAFASYDNAEKMYNNIRQNNLPVFIDSTELYRIKIGGFQDKISAVEILEKINLTGWFVFQERIKQKGIIEFYIDSEKYIFKDGIIKKE